jgi:hypothetical protein
MKKHLPLLPMLIWLVFSCVLLWRIEVKKQNSPWKLCSEEMPSDNELLYAFIENDGKKKVVLGKYVNNSWELHDSDGYAAPLLWRPFNSMPGDEEIIK